MKNDLWKNIANGDKEAYAELYELFFKKLYTYGKKFTADKEVIEDSIQDVFYEIWTKRERIKTVDTPAAYFLSAFRYILLKRIKRTTAALEEMQFSNELELSFEHLKIASEVQQELQIKLSAALAILTPRQREAIYLRFYLGLAYEEVALVLNITTKATYKIISRSLLSLRKQWPA